MRVKTIGNYDFVISEWIKQELSEAKTPYVNGDKSHMGWQNGNPCHTGHRMFFKGDTIYSYHNWWPMARLLPNRRALLNVERYSVTTSAHTNQVHSALRRADYQVFGVNKDIPLQPDPSHLLKDLKKQHLQVMQARERLLYNGWGEPGHCGWMVRSLIQAQKDYLEFCSEFNFPTEYTLTKDHWKEIGKRYKVYYDRRELKRFALKLTEGKELR